jgi:Adenylosuccinate lyase
VSLFSANFEGRTLAALFDDAAWISAFVRVEVAWSRAQAGAGVIPSSAAEAIARGMATFSPDLEKLAAATKRDGFPIVELVAQLRTYVGGESGEFVHWGATTQDVIDTALVLQLGAATDVLERRLGALAEALAYLAQTHRDTLMVARTHLQPAVPTTFGLKVACWLAPIVRHRRRLAEMRTRFRVVQCGGAGGTLASLGTQGLHVAERFAAELGLAVPPVPWHAQRDAMFECASWLAAVATSVAKIAQDVLLLSQAELGELVESSETDRGSSSAMPQKNNPVLSETILIASRNVAAHFGGLLATPAPEHERGTQTVQSELLHLPAMCVATGAALRAAEQLARGLVIDVDRMRENVTATRGVLLAEAVTMVLARHLGRAEARRVVREACDEVRAGKGSLIEIVRGRVEATETREDLPKNEAEYLGSAGHFVDRVLAGCAAVSAPR